MARLGRRRRFPPIRLRSIVPVPPSTGTLTRTTSGLLAMNAWNGDALPRGSGDFVPADWTSSTGITLTTVADKSLHSTNGNTSLWYVSQRTSIASRGKTFIFAEMSSFAGANPGTMGPAVHVTQVSTPTCAGGMFTVARVAGELARLLKFASGTASTVVADVSVSTKTLGTHYKNTTFVDGTALASCDLTSATTSSGTLVASSGQVGIANGGGTIEVHRWIAATDRYVTVSGVPSGGSAEIRTPGTASVASTTLASGLESGGTATIDLFGLDAAQAQSVRVLDSWGNILASYQDTTGGASNNLIAGGDVFAFAVVNTIRSFVSAIIG